MIGNAFQAVGTLLKEGGDGTMGTTTKVAVIGVAFTVWVLIMVCVYTWRRRVVPEDRSEESKLQPPWWEWRP